VKNKILHVAMALSVVLLAACGDDTPATTEVYTSAGSVQCSGGGATLAQMQGRLQAAGVEVAASSCGLDGNVQAAVCGAPDGRIGVFAVPETATPAASAAGFQPLSSLPRATKTAC
jgi:hypothetical protein